jgi:sRNA-binding protein
LFGGEPKPLAIGVGETIMARAGAAGFKRYTVGTALHHWTQSPLYLAAIAGEGAMRWSLAGEAVERVATEHQAGARQQLAALAQAKTARERGVVS